MSAVVQVPRGFEEQVHGPDLNDVKDIVVIEIQARSEAGYLNGKSYQRQTDRGKDPIPILPPNGGGMDRGA
jgi:hypothetical protein